MAHFMKNYWDDLTEFYDTLWEHRGDDNFYLETAKRIGGPILECGCGTGRLLLPIAKSGIKCYGIDFSKKMLQVLQNKIDKSPKIVKENFRIKYGDITKPFKYSIKFNFVVMAAVTSGFYPGLKSFNSAVKHLSNNLLQDKGYFLFERRAASTKDFPDKTFTWFKWWKEKKCAVVYYRTTKQIDKNFREDIHHFEIMDMKGNVTKKVFPIKI